MNGHVVLCGTGGIGGRIAEQLHRAGETVVVLQEFAAAELPTLVRQWGLRTVPPAGSLSETLIAADIEVAKAVVCVTGDDLTNLQIALLARQNHPDLRGWWHSGATPRSGRRCRPTAARRRAGRGYPDRADDRGCLPAPAASPAVDRASRLPGRRAPGEAGGHAARIVRRPGPGSG